MPCVVIMLAYYMFTIEIYSQNHKLDKHPCHSIRKLKNVGNDPFKLEYFTAYLPRRCMNPISADPSEGGD